MLERDIDRLNELKSQISAAYGREPLDLLVQGVRLVNVYSGNVVLTNIGIKAGRVVTISPENPPVRPIAVFEGDDMYAIPGLIDAHCHIESTLLTPAALSGVIVPQGTTTLLIDPMEIANVAGYEGLMAFMHGIDTLPYRIFIEVSSRVPTAPGLETTGGVLGINETEYLLDHPRAVSLGELDPSKIDTLSDEHLLKIIAARWRGKIANGHAIGLDGLALQAYATAGLSDDHECVTFDELQARVELGMTVMIREGSSERNLDTLVSGIVEVGMETRNLIFCTDDKHTSDILCEGHILQRQPRDRARPRPDTGDSDGDTEYRAALPHRPPDWVDHAWAFRGLHSLSVHGQDPTQTCLCRRKARRRRGETPRRYPQNRLSRWTSPHGQAASQFDQ